MEIASMLPALHNRSLEAVVDRRRLDAFVERLQEVVGQREVAAFLEEWPEEEDRIWRDLHGPERLPAAAETRILTKFCDRFQVYHLLKDVGRECFHGCVERLRPMPFDQLASAALLHWTAAYCSFFRSHLSLHIELLPDGARIYFYYADSLKESVVDFVFWRSFISALLSFSGFRNFQVQEEATMLDAPSIPASLFPQSALEYNAPASRLLLQIPAEQLRLSVAELSDPDRSPGSDMNARFVDEVMQRSARILQDKRELLTAVEFLNIANNELEREIQANKRELSMARNIQKGFVPRRIPDWNGLQFWVKFFPLTEVSGDFYDYFTIGSNKFGFMVCDVSGHGVPAALISAIAKLSFNNHRYDSPAEVFSRVNLDILNYVKTEGYLTSFYMLMDADYNIRYSVAAAPAPLLLRKRTGKVERLECNGTLIGMFQDAGKYFEDRTVRLEPGDKLFVFTDGLTEIQNAQEEHLGEERLIAVVRETWHMDIKAASEHVMQFYNRFHLGADPSDDLTFITISLSERIEEFRQHLRRARELAGKLTRLEEAVAELRQAHAIFPQHTGMLYMLGKLLRRIHRFAEAIEALEEYNALRPYNADSYRLLGECALNLRDHEQARHYLEKSLSLRAENPTALYLLGRLYVREKNLNRAQECLQVLLDIRPDSKETLDLQQRLRK